MSVTTLSSTVAGSLLSAGSVALGLVGSALVEVAAGGALIYLVMRFLREVSRRYFGRDFRLMYRPPVRRRPPSRWEFEAYDLVKGRESSAGPRGLHAAFGFRDVGGRVAAPVGKGMEPMIPELEQLFTGLGVMDWQQSWWDPDFPDSWPGRMRPGAPAGAAASANHQFVGPPAPVEYPGELLASELLDRFEEAREAGMSPEEFFAYRDGFGHRMTDYGGEFGDADPDAGEI